MEQLRHLWRERLTPQEHSGLVGTLSQNSQSSYATPWESMAYTLGHNFSRAPVVPEKKLREEALRFVTAASDRRMWSGGGR